MPGRGSACCQLNGDAVRQATHFRDARRSCTLSVACVSAGHWCWTDLAPAWLRSRSSGSAGSSGGHVHGHLRTVIGRAEER